MILLDCICPVCDILAYFHFLKDLVIYDCDTYNFNKLNALFVSSICCDLGLIVLTFIVTIFMYILLLSTDVFLCLALMFSFLFGL